MFCGAAWCAGGCCTGNPCCFALGRISCLLAGLADAADAADYLARKPGIRAELVERYGFAAELALSGMQASAASPEPLFPPPVVQQPRAGRAQELAQGR